MNIDMNKFTNKYFILFIVVFAFLLRIYRIDSIPPSLSWDEVSIGYNAYSILKTGKDEHGRFLPLDTFIGYGDYKPPLAIYLTIPSVAIFGLNELAVRFPSALFGTLTVLFTYFLVKELFSNTKNYELGTKNLPLLSAALLALSPWHINLSRTGFEANIALFFIVLGVLIALKAIDRPKMWTIAWIPFVAAIYTFNSSRYFAPFMGVGLLFMGWNSIKKNSGYFIIGIGITIILLLPIVPHLLSKEARLRFTEVNIFSDPEIVLVSNKRIEEAGGVWWAKIVFNRRIGYARSYALHFLDHFQPDYLFIKGDGNPKFSIQDVGQLYTIEAPFLAIGILWMLVMYPSIALFLLYWMVMAIVPAAVARETPHALRTLNSLPTWQIFTAFGILTFVAWINSRMKTIVYFTFYFLLFTFYLFNVVYYLHNYYRHYPIEYSGEWQYGYKQALEFIAPIEKNYDTIYMSESIGRPYMYTLFYNKTDPKELFQTKDASFDAAGFYHVYGFGKFRFVQDMPTSCSGRCLYIATPGTEMKKNKLLHTVYLLNGNPVLTIYE
jgi:4-amino-4-deoxy-L-arabinose transferase-like glycosyltransferase